MKLVIYKPRWIVDDKNVQRRYTRGDVNCCVQRNGALHHHGVHQISTSHIIVGPRKLNYHFTLLFFSPSLFFHLMFLTSFVTVSSFFSAAVPLNLSEIHTQRKRLFCFFNYLDTAQHLFLRFCSFSVLCFNFMFSVSQSFWFVTTLSLTHTTDSAHTLFLFLFPIFGSFNFWLCPFTIYLWPVI